MTRVLVTGASGFIGGTVCEMLVLSSNTEPIAAVRAWQRGVRPARLGVELRLADVNEPESLDAAMGDCDCVVHCAVGDDRTTIEGTRNVATAAERTGIRRLVHLSSVAVYGNAPGHYLESSLGAEQITAYGRRKLTAETIVTSSRVPWTILRPTIVYGPFSTQWTINFAQRLVAGTIGDLGSGGLGSCNLVYITDLVRVIEASLTDPAAEFQIFNVNGPELPTWNEYFLAFAEALGIEELPTVDMRALRARARILALVRSVGSHVAGRHRGELVALSKMSTTADRALRSTESGLRLTPTAEQLSLFEREVTFPAARLAAAGLPVSRVDVQSGVRRSADWLRSHGLVPVS